MPNQPLTRPRTHLDTLGVRMYSGCSIGSTPFLTDVTPASPAPTPSPALPPLAALAPPIDNPIGGAATADRAALSVTAFMSCSSGAKFW